MADFYHKRFKYFFYSCVERLKLYFPSCINPFHPIDYIDCNIVWKLKRPRILSISINFGELAFKQKCVSSTQRLNWL